jgi:CRISPR-associated endonuclease/helicase Cas3
MCESSQLTLWAKSPFLGEPPTVLRHCLDVLACARLVWANVERDLAEALNCEVETLRESIRSLFFLAALFHDAGKMNSAFQSLLHPENERLKQPVRHEILSALMVRDDWPAEFSAALPEQDLWSILWAVAGHHLQMRVDKHGNENEDPLYRTGNTPRNVTTYCGHAQFEGLWETAKSLLPGLRLSETQLDLKNETFKTADDSDDGLEARIREFVMLSRKAWKPFKKDNEFKRRLALLKALLISADVSGSALTSRGEPPSKWIPRALQSRLSGQDIERIWRDTLGLRQPRDFQRQVAASKHPATVVVAGCGNGKTTAAYMWAQNWPNRKLFFTYPTTGTTSAGFEDYVLEQSHVTRELIHGRSQVDLAEMGDTPEDAATDASLRIESLNAWDRQLIVCTVDTVLGLLQNQRRPLFSFPAIVAGAFVLDEIHSYDSKLFGALLNFLQTFPGLPVLLMSASIPPARLLALREVLGDRMGDVVRGDPSLETRRRYRFEPVQASPDDCWADVERSLRSNEKVLWVCNTVRDAVEVAAEARQRGMTAEPPLIYHSRFRYRDRVQRQKAVIDEFAYHDAVGRERERKKPGGSLIVTTQVCEMSLDISADLLVTALCPLPSLVQRLGRLNRFAQSDDPRPCLVYGFQGPPYHQDDARAQMTAARQAIEQLTAQAISQKDLSDCLEDMTTKEKWDLSSAWLDGGWQTDQFALRDGDNGITVLREEDLPLIERELGPEDAKTWTRQRLVPWTIPMRYRNDFAWQRRLAAYPLAPAGTIDYDEREGAKWLLNRNK